MRFSAALTLSAISLRTHWKTWAWVAAGMAIGSFALGISVFSGLGFSQSLKTHLQSIFPENRIILQPKMTDISVLRVETGTITTQTLATVRAFPGVRRVSPEATLRFPVSAEATLFGGAYRTDITVTGVEPWLLGADAPADFTYEIGKEREVPAILAAYFLDLYNLALAEGNHLPKLSPAAVINRKFNLVLGESSIHPSNEGARVAIETGRIVALSRNPDLLGLMIPLEAVEAFNKWYGLSTVSYRRLHVELASPAAMDSLKKQLPEMKLEILDSSGPWRKLAGFLDLVGFGFAALGVLIFALALAYLLASINWLLIRRQRERALLLTLGCGRADLTLLMTAETALVAGLGIASGLVGSAALFRQANAWYHAWRLGRTYLPEHLFAAPWGWIGALGVLCWALAIALPCRRIHSESVTTPIAALNAAETH